MFFNSTYSNSSTLFVLPARGAGWYMISVMRRYRCGSDRAGAEGEAGGPGKLPARDVDGECVGVDQLDIFLGLVAGRRVEFNLSKVDDRIRRLAGRNAFPVQCRAVAGEKRAPAGQMD